MQLVQVKYGSIAELFYHSGLIFSDGDGDSKVMDHIYCLDIEGAIPKGWPLATASAFEPTPLLQNPSFPAVELEPTPSGLVDDPSADHHLSITPAIDRMVNESGNSGSPSQTASVTGSSIVVGLPSQSNPTVVQESPFPASKTGSQLFRTGRTELSGERGPNESPPTGGMDVDGEAQAEVEDKSPMPPSSNSLSSIAAAGATELDPNDMFTARSNAGPGKVSSKVPSTTISAFGPELGPLFFQSDSDLTDLEDNSNSVHHSSESNRRNANSAPPKRKRNIHDGSDSIKDSSESDTDSDQDPSQLDNKHSKSIARTRKRKTGPGAKRQKRNPAGPTSHSNSALSRDSPRVPYSTLASQRSLERKYSSEENSYSYSGTIAGPRIDLDIVTVCICCSVAE
jgi:hypothetical protein